MNINDGRNVNHVATAAAAAPATNTCSGPNSCVAQPPTKPTNATTMIRGPGVVSPSAKPSIICGGVSQPKVSTAPCTTYGSTAYAPPKVTSAALVKNQPICASTLPLPSATTSAPSEASQRSSETAMTVIRRDQRKRACAGVGVSSSMIAGACVAALAACAA